MRSKNLSLILDHGAVNYNTFYVACAEYTNNRFRFVNAIAVKETNTVLYIWQ